MGSIKHQDTAPAHVARLKVNTARRCVWVVTRVIYPHLHGHRAHCCLRPRGITPPSKGAPFGEFIKRRRFERRRKCDVVQTSQHILCVIFVCIRRGGNKTESRNFSKVSTTVIVPLCIDWREMEGWETEFYLNIVQRGVAVCCSVLQCVVVLQCVAVCCSVLQCVAVCCSVLQCVAVSYISMICPQSICDS